MIIGAKINNLIKEHNITQEILADKVGVSQTKIHEIVSGKTKKVDFLFMHKVCEVFEVGFEYFVENENEKYVFKKNQNNNIVVGKIEVLNNNMPEGILENMLKRLELLEKILHQNK